MAEYPDWLPPSAGGTEPPPCQPDWYAVWEIAADAGVDFFRFAGLPCEEPHIGYVFGWGLIRRRALALLSQRTAALAEGT